MPPHIQGQAGLDSEQHDIAVPVHWKAIVIDGPKGSCPTQVIL